MQRERQGVSEPLLPQSTTRPAEKRLIPMDSTGSIKASGNLVKKTKYTVYSFFFVNFFQQVTKPSNMYFIAITCLQMIDLISISEGVPVMLLPMVIIVFVSMVKDAYEDYQRHKKDNEENKSPSILVYQNGRETACKWRELKVGHVVKVCEN